MPLPLPTPVPLPVPQLAFVVQLQRPTAQQPHTLAGRIEHIASGEVVRFATFNELAAYLARTCEAAS